MQADHPFLNYSPTIKEGADTEGVSWIASGKDNPWAGLNISILLCLQSSKHTKRCRANTTSPWKWKKLDTESIAEVEDALSEDERNQTILSQYVFNVPVACRLDGLWSQNKR